MDAVGRALLAVQRIACRATVLNYLARHIFGPACPMKIAAAIVGEFEKILQAEHDTESVTEDVLESRRGEGHTAYVARLAGQLYEQINDADPPPAGAGADYDDSAAEVDVPWRHMLALVDLLLRHFPSAGALQRVAAAGVKASAAREAELRAVEALQRLQAEEVAVQEAAQEGAFGIGVSSRQLTSREVFSQRQAVNAGIADASTLEGIEDESKAATVEIEVNDAVPQFLQGLARTNRVNYYRAPTNLADQRAREATNLEKHGTSMAKLAEQMEKRNVDRSRLRALERKRREEAAKAGGGSLAWGSTANTSDQPEGAAAAASGADGGAAAKTITEGELDEAPPDEGVRSARDVHKLAPWLQASLGGKDVKFGYQSASGQTLEEQRRSLPVYEYRHAIVSHVRSHTVTILQGETGSGKTTQIPQFLLEAGFCDDNDEPNNTNNGRNNGPSSSRRPLMIGVTQPRRVAAIELAKRVAKERGCRCGDEVGYTVRFEDQTSRLTKVKYMTDGMLLREALLDDTFQNYSVIMLDEAHERSINTDVLFGVLKKAVRKRPSLKVIITSATIELERFGEYFGVAEHFQVAGKTFPVTTHYLQEPCEDYVDRALRTVMEIHLKDRGVAGDILVFLTGQDEIDTAAERLHTQFTDLQAKVKHLPAEKQPADLLILPCYATLPSEAMSKVFEPAPPNTRKVVLSTNVAETSITIDGLRYVVDCGFCKQHVYDPKHKVDQLKIVPASRAQATQRAGRAGRTAPGTCYRLYTEEQFERDMEPATVPEIQRTNLVNIVLTLRAVGIEDLFDFDFLDPPPQETLVNALQTLRYLGALESDGRLSSLGQRMSALPLRPSESKTLLTAIDFGCAPTVMTIVALLDRRNLFYRPVDRREEADFARRMLQHPDGDQLTLANVYNAWVDSGMSDDWCRRNFVNPRAVREAHKTREQLTSMLSAHRESLAIDRRDSVLIRKALTSGYFFQVAKRGAGNEYVTMSDRREVAMHPSSSLFEATPQYVVYNELFMTKKEYMREVMRIDPNWLVELAPAFFRRPKKGELTKEQRAARLDPILRPWEQGNSWRISKLKRVA